MQTSLHATQFSPLIPGALDLGEARPASLDAIAILAPQGTIERRYVIAQALRALQPGSRLVVLAPKAKGGLRLAGDLRSLGCASDESSRHHHRMCFTDASGDAAEILVALAAGDPRKLDGLWTQPGVFSWNRLDPGSALLLEHLPALAGRGADFGCGTGVLSRAILSSARVTTLAMIDIDRRSIAMARRNITDARAKMIWADLRTLEQVSDLDFVAMNPPFHEGAIENHSLGQSFIQRAALALRKGGVCWLTANRHLPYEAILRSLFARVLPVVEANGYKIYQAQK